MSITCPECHGERTAWECPACDGTGVERCGVCLRADAVEVDEEDGAMCARCYGDRSDVDGTENRKAS